MLPLAFWPPFEDAFKLPQWTILWMMAWALTAWIALRAAADPPALLPFRRLAGPPIVLLLWVLCAGIGQSPLQSMLILTGFMYGIALLPGLVPPSALSRLPIVAVLGGVVSALYSLAQYAGLDFTGAPGAAGLRPFSTMGNPDFLAAYLVAVLPVGVAWWFHRPSPWRAAGCVILTAGLLLAQSRGAWIGMAASAVAASVLVLRRGRGFPIRPVLMAGGGLAILAALTFGFSGQARERLAETVSIRHFDAAGRLFMWRATLGLIRSRPLIGGGLGSFGVRYPAAHASLAATWPGIPWFWSENSHNDYLQLAADTGVIGLGLFAWIWTAFLRAAHCRWRSGSPLALGVLAGFVAVASDACFNFPWYLLPVQGWFWFSWAWLHPGRESAIAPSSVTGRRFLAAVLAVPLLAALSFVLGPARDLEANAWLKRSGDLVAAAQWPEARVCALRSLDRARFWENPQRAANNGALAAYSAGDFPGAEMLSRRSLALFPDQPAALNQLGLALARQGKTAEAADAARRALALNPRQAESWHLLGNLAFLAHDRRGAAAYWEAALRENPDLPGLKESLGALLRGGGASGKR